jgi:chromatin structure-remodeling complex subunit RSC1/2
VRCQIFDFFTGNSSLDKQLRKVYSTTKSISEMSERERKKLSNKLQPLFDKLYTIKDKHGFQLSETFHRLPLRTGTDYYKIVLNPLSLHAIGRKIKKHEYEVSQQFINDLALVSWNARLYNIKESRVYIHAIILKQYIQEYLIPKLKADKNLPGHKIIHYPELGDLPDEKDEITIESINFDEPIPVPNIIEPSSATPRATPYPPNQQDSYSRSQAYSAYGSKPSSGSPTPYSKQSKTLESGIRRGRPPIIDRPFETRIKLILKGFKKLRDPNNENRSLTSHFDRLPDSKYYPNYYSVIHNPISLNEIKIKVRTRKYTNVDQFINDLNLLFTNAKTYYQNDPYSEEYVDFENFKREANIIIQQELKRPEHELIVASTSGNDGVLRYPLDSLEVNGYTYKIGDWVLIQNPNDPEKPIVGQVFRLWSTDDGNKYTNVCWYYRPEQTCHKEDRLFFMNEVCKTGQYRDHLVNEIVGPCYVVFLTRYQKGDLPDGVIPDGAPWFICEFRYNESTHVFNRIRTWKACLPDEVRDNYEHPLIPLHEQRKLIKYESPIRELLPPDAYEGMSIPEPTQGNFQNTPPLVGSVYLARAKLDDDLGQFISSPNVTSMPEHNDTESGRAAYLFTPISQLKGGGGATSTIYANSYSSGMSLPMGGDGLMPSYATPNDATNYLPGGYRLLQVQSQDARRYADPQYPPPYQPQYQPQLQPKQEFKRPTSYTPTTAPSNIQPSQYSGLVGSGVVSYTVPDTAKLSDVSDCITKKRKMVEGAVEHDIVFYRAPPVSVESNRVVTSNGTKLHHSAKYLAWKISQVDSNSAVET